MVRPSGSAVLLALWGVCAAAQAAPPLDYTLTVRVEAAPSANVPESLREELEIAVLDAVDLARCFRSAVRYDPDRPPREGLLYRIGLDEYEEQIQYLSSLAQRAQPNPDPDAARQLIAHVDTLLSLEVFTAGDGRRVRGRRLNLDRARRPLLAEDAAHELRLEVVDDASRAARVFVCKGSAQKWAKEIARARPVADPPR